MSLTPRVSRGVPLSPSHPKLRKVPPHMSPWGALLTFEQLHIFQLKGNVVLLGKDVDRPAGLGQKVQVELQPHSSARWTDGVAEH